MSGHTGSELASASPCVASAALKKTALAAAGISVCPRSGRGWRLFEQRAYLEDRHIRPVARFSCHEYRYVGGSYAQDFSRDGNFCVDRSVNGRTGFQCSPRQSIDRTAGTRRRNGRGGGLRYRGASARNPIAAGPAGAARQVRHCRSVSIDAARSRWIGLPLSHSGGTAGDAGGHGVLHHRPHRGGRFRAHG